MSGKARKYIASIVMSLFIIAILFGTYINVNAANISDGWHFVEATGDSERDNKEYYHWAYYKNGEEVKRYRKLVSSHRGWATGIPENSLAAFKKATEEGVLEVETDVRFTLTGTPVLIHDPALYRVARYKECTDGNCKVGATAGYVEGGAGNCNNKDTRTANGDVYVKDHSVTWLNDTFSFNVPTRNPDGTHPDDADPLDAYKNNTVTTFKMAIDYAKTSGLHFAFELKDECDEVTKENMKTIWNAVKENDQTGQFTWICNYPNIKPCTYLKEILDDENSNTIENINITAISDKATGDTVYNQLKTNKTRVWVEKGGDEEECAKIEYFKRVAALLPLYWDQDFLDNSPITAGRNLKVARFKQETYVREVEKKSDDGSKDDESKESKSNSERINNVPNTAANIKTIIFVLGAVLIVVGIYTIWKFNTKEKNDK